jgi:16S rRNA (guanine(1405)-N(7))-methyltransferase
MDDRELDRLVEAVLGSPKYATVAPDFVRAIGAQELARRRKLKEAVKATKNKLHQVGGAYLSGRLDYAAWLAQLRAAVNSGDPAELRRACVRVMRHHSSTKERLPVLDAFYATALAGLPPIRTVLDVACGLNPLAIPWMGLAADAEYYACDVYRDMVDFLNEFLALIGVDGRAEVCDLSHACPTRKVDLALALKTIPCLEQVDKSAGRRLLGTLDASHLLVSFPARSLGGRDKGMPVNYESHFRELAAGKNWTVRRFEFATELAFLVSKDGGAFN